MIARQFLNRFVCLVVVCLFGFGVASHSHAQEEMPEEFNVPFSLINQKSVTATISFLASDEMAGRDTPSAELTIASAYIAARFRGAGLKGLGDDDSFFQTTEIDVVSVPQTGIVLKQNGNAVEQFGLLSAGAGPFSFDGEVTFIDGATPRDKKFDGPVCITADAFDSRRSLNNFLRKTARLMQSGATAILVQVDSSHPLVARAAVASRPRLSRQRSSGGGVPVVLVETLDAKGEFSMRLPRRIQGKAEVRNVIGMLPGSDPELADEAIIFTAHLDHIGVRDAIGDTIFNGADDDATGVTGVVTLADAYSSLPVAPKRTVIFMTYWGEEKGLLGSRYYAANPAWPLEKTIANVNIEMIGRPESGAHEKCWVTGWHRSDLGKLMNDGAQKAGVLVFEHPKFSAMLYRSSDNYSLAEKGVIAHSFSAGSLHSDYHQVTDEWEKLELKHMTRVIQGLFAGTLAIANGDVTPKRAEGRQGK